MKKIAILFVALAAISSNHLSAQDRGDMFISASLSGATGSTSNVIRSGALSSTTSDLYSPSFGASLEFGAFLVNNLKTAICIGYEYDADKYYSDNSVYTATDNLVYLNLLTCL